MQQVGYSSYTNKVVSSDYKNRHNWRVRRKDETKGADEIKGKDER